MLLVLLGAVGLLLLIACVNAANLLLARSQRACARDCGAVRAGCGTRAHHPAIGDGEPGDRTGRRARWGRCWRWAECACWWPGLPAGFPRAGEIRLDSAVFAVTLLVAVLTGLIFGLVPAVTAARTDLQQSLREGGRGATGGGRQLRLRNFLVVGETGLACVLLIAAGLMLHSFVNLMQADSGFRPQQVLTASVSLPFESYRNGRRSRQFPRTIDCEPAIDSRRTGRRPGDGLAVDGIRRKHRWIYGGRPSGGIQRQDDGPLSRSVARLFPRDGNSAGARSVLHGPR